MTAAISTPDRPAPKPPPPAVLIRCDRCLLRYPPHYFSMGGDAPDSDGRRVCIECQAGRRKSKTVDRAWRRTKRAVLAEHVPPARAPVNPPKILEPGIPEHPIKTMPNVVLATEQYTNLQAEIRAFNSPAPRRFKNQREKRLYERAKRLRERAPKAACLEAQTKQEQAAREHAKKRRLSPGTEGTSPETRENPN